MKKLLPLLLLVLFLASCGGSKRATSSRKSSQTATIKPKGRSSNKIATNVVKTAYTFKGTPYKYGGTTKSGMDCSGLVYTSFKKENIQLPRVSRDMATRGNKISLSKAAKGDLVFFRTNKNKKTINHVGLIVAINGSDIQFIHSSSSKGVIVSSLKENYWKNAFVEIRRII